jgi:hypothetical protein
LQQLPDETIAGLPQGLFDAACEGNARPRNTSRARRASGQGADEALRAAVVLPSQKTSRGFYFETEAMTTVAATVCITSAIVTPTSHGLERRTNKPVSTAINNAAAMNSAIRPYPCDVIIGAFAALGEGQ